VRLTRLLALPLLLAAVTLSIAHAAAAPACSVLQYIQGISQANSDVIGAPPRINDALSVLQSDVSRDATLVPVLQPVINDLTLNPPALDDARTRLGALAGVLVVPQGTACGVDSGPALGALHDVYASPVFAGLDQTQPPSIFEQIGSILSTVASHIGGALGAGGVALLASLLVAALITLLAWRVRAAGAGRRARAEVEPAEAGDDPAAEWRAAERAAGRGEFREAVRRAFRGVLLEVAHRGRMRIDAAWTTRELLHAARGDPALLAALAAASDAFDRAWYSGRATTESGWLEAKRRCEAVRSLARRSTPQQAA